MASPTFSFLAAAFLLLFFLGCVAPMEPGNGNPTNETVRVSIENFSFQSSALTISPGTTVIWTNNDSVGHTVTSSTFDSGIIPPGGTYTRTFTQTGNTNYHCTPHPHMTGTINVN